MFHGTVRYSRFDVFHFLNAMGKGSFSLLCSKDWLVSVPGPTFEGTALHQVLSSPWLPMKATGWAIFMVTAVLYPLGLGTKRSPRPPWLQPV